MFNKIFKSPLVRVCARYGTIAGAACMLFVITFFYMDKHPFLVNAARDFRIPLFAILMFFSLKEVRDYYQGGILHFFQGTGGGLVLVVVCSVISAAGIIIFGSIESRFLTDYIQEITKQIQAYPAEAVEQIGKAVVEETLKALPNTTLYGLAATFVGQNFVFGFFISVIISVILRRQPSNP